MPQALKHPRNRANLMKRLLVCLALVLPAISWGQPKPRESSHVPRSNEREQVREYRDADLSRLPEAPQPPDDENRVRRIPNPVIDNGPPNPCRQWAIDRRGKGTKECLRWERPRR